MKNRLEIARELLMDDGSIYIQTDVNEAHYLKILVDDVFGTNNFRSEIIWDTSIPYVAGNKWLSNNWIYSHSSIFYYAKNKNKVLFKKQTFDVQQPSGDISKKPIKDVWADIRNFAGFLGAKDIKLNFKTRKPEHLLMRIIEASTDPGDIVLDFFSGSGTTGAVAHKMNRRWIMIEQMVNQVDIEKRRLFDVINGEQGGISKALNWKGGGSFIYFELATYNQKFIDEIEQAKDSTTLLEIWDEMKNCGFLLHNIEVKKWDENISEFERSELKEQKEILIQTLNMNMLYVPLSDIEDVKYNISDDDIALNKVFYGDEYISTEI